MLIAVDKANDGKYKYVATFSNGKRVKFGAFGMSDYTIHKDKDRRNLYRLRHKKDLDTRDPMRAGYLSYYLLWGDSTDLKQNIKDYNKRFFNK